MNASEAKQFIKAGKATFTVVSAKTGARFTYRVTKADKADLFFASVLTGPDNTSDYTYAGVITPDLAFKPTKASKIGAEAPSVVALKWALGSIEAGKLAGFDIHHEGRCGACNRPLTDPVSIKTGLGPICRERGL